MNILIIENDIPYANSLRAEYSQHAITVTEDLLRLHSFLFVEPGIEYFHAFFLDLHINFGSLTIDEVEAEFKADFPQLFATPFFKFNDAIPLHGWDYYNRIICKDERTKNYADRFLLISGHAPLLSIQADEAEIKAVGDRLISKYGGTDNQIRLILDRLEKHGRS